MKNLNPEIIIGVAKAAGAVEVLRFLAKDGDAETVGRKALLLAFLLAPEAIGRQKQLAKRMGVSEGRASQMLSALKRFYPD